MIYYINKFIAAFNKTDTRGRGINTSSAPEDLYKVYEDCDNISTDKAKMFYNILSNTLYNTKKSRQYTCSAVASPTTIVIEPKKYDWYKLVHLMKYIRGTRYLTLILSANGSGVIKWFIGASYSVHPNIWVHTSGGLSMRRGLPS